MHAIREIQRSIARLATKEDLATARRTIMSAISEFAARQSAFQDTVDNAINGLQADVAFLTATIAELQQNPGPITPEDQALLDALDTRMGTVASKLEALDALTPPAPPVA